MPLPRFRIRTLMIAVAVVAMVACEAKRAYEDDSLIGFAVFMAVPVAFIATCVRVIHYPDL